MGDFLGLAQQALFFGFFITLAFAVTSAAALPAIMSRANARIPAATRASLYTLICSLPLLAAVVILFLAILPSLLEVLGIGSDHCLGHPEGHIHFCLVHRHAVIDHWLVWLPALASMFMLASAFLVLLADILAIRRFRDTLQQFRRDRGPDTNPVILETKTPLALSCGLLKPRIYLSTGLLDRLSNDERMMIIGHERAHGRRFDALRMWLARSLSIVHLPPVRRRLLDELDMACEQACDESTLDTRHTPDRLAALLLKVERLYQGYFSAATPLAPSVTGTGSLLEHRIRYLLLPARSLPVSSTHILGLVCLVCLGLLLSHDTVHDSLEHLMALLVKR